MKSATRGQVTLYKFLSSKEYVSDVDLSCNQFPILNTHWGLLFNDKKGGLE